MAYPQQVNPNGWQVLGQALSQGGQLVENEVDKRSRLQMLMQEAAEKKAAAKLAQIKADRDAKIAAAEEARKAEQARGVKDFRTFAQGEQKETQPAQPYFAPGMGPQGQTATDPIMETVRPSREALQQKALETGAYSDPGVKAYMDDTGIGGGSTPATVAEWNYYSSLPQQDQARFLEMKRAQKTIDLGGSHGIVGLGGEITKTVPKSLAPNERPEVKGAQAAAAAAGTESVTGAAAINKEKAERERAEAAQKHQAYKLGKAGEVESIKGFVSLVDSVAANKDLYGVTGAGKGLSNIWGSDYADLHADLNKIVSSGAIETMAKLKRESPTGSTGFGALSEKELKIIQDAFSVLSDRNISADKARSELKRISTLMNKYLSRVAEFEKANPAASPTTGAVKWGRDASGRPVRIQ